MQLMYFNLHPPHPFSFSVANCRALSCLPPSPGGWQALQGPLYKHRLNKVAVARRKVSILFGEEGSEGWGRVLGPGYHARL